MAMKMKLQRPIGGDGISLRLWRSALEADRLLRLIKSSSLSSSKRRDAIRCMDKIALDARLLWDVRMVMLKQHPLPTMAIDRSPTSVAR
jgi:hypothetical protein